MHTLTTLIQIQIQTLTHIIHTILQLVKLQNRSKKKDVK